MIAGVFVFMTTGFYLPWFISLILLIGLIIGIQWAVRNNPSLAIGMFAVLAFTEGIFIGPGEDEAVPLPQDLLVMERLGEL